MNDERKTKKDLIAKLEGLRGEVAEKDGELKALRQTSGDYVSATKFQLAVERVRAEAMAMHKSDDLYALSCSFLVEVRQLGIDASYISVAIIDDDRIVNYYWAVIDQDNKVNIRDMSPDEMPEERMKKKLHLHRTNEVSTHYSKSYGVFIHDIPIPKGIIGFAEQVDDEQHVKKVAQLAEAFSLGYLRFLDFQQLEQQAEQARRERAVEIVRAEATSMRQSGDLSKVMTLVCRELLRMGIDTRACNAYFYDEDNDARVNYHAGINPGAFGDWHSTYSNEVVDDDIVVSANHRR